MDMTKPAFCLNFQKNTKLCIQECCSLWNASNGLLESGRLSSWSVLNCPIAHSKIARLKPVRLISTIETFRFIAVKP